MRLSTGSEQATELHGIDVRHTQPSGMAGSTGCSLKLRSQSSPSSLIGPSDPMRLSVPMLPLLSTRSRPITSRLALPLPLPLSLIVVVVLPLSAMVSPAL